jgi:hypothetical protein
LQRVLTQQFTSITVASQKLFPQQTSLQRLLN